MRAQQSGGQDDEGRCSHRGIIYPGIATSGDAAHTSVHATGNRWRTHSRLAAELALFSCYTEFVPKNITIKISDEAALWARRRAAEENTSVSRLVGGMLEHQMRLTDEYWKAFEHWKSNRPLAGASASQRMSREEVHERR